MTTTQPRARARAALPRAFSLDQELIEALLELERSSELLPRPDRERVEKWAQRLASVPLPTVASKRNRNQYALLLVQQVKQCTAATKAGSNQLNWRPPFHRDPPAGLLPRLPPALSCLVESRRVRTAPWQRIFGSLASSAVLPAAEFDSCGSLEVDAEKTKHTDQTKRLPKRRVRFVGVEDKNQVAGAAGVHSDQPPPPVVAPAAVAAAPAADADGRDIAASMKENSRSESVRLGPLERNRHLPWTTIGAASDSCSLRRLTAFGCSSSLLSVYGGHSSSHFPLRYLSCKIDKPLLSSMRSG